MQTLLPVVLSFAFSQILLSVLLMLRLGRNWSVQQWLFLLFLMAISCYLAAPVVDSKLLKEILSALNTAVPGVFWLLCASVFDDHFRLKTWKVCLVLATIVPPQLFKLMDQPVWSWLFMTAPQLLEFVLLSMAFWVVAKSWRGDLIESRRILRLWYLGLGSVFIFTLLLFRELIVPGAPWLSPWQFLPVAIMSLITNMVLLDFKDGIWAPVQLLSFNLEVNSQLVHKVDQDEFVVATQVYRPEVTEEEREFLTKIADRMESQYTYRQMGLTIGQLASTLELPEYRLRKLINSQMGYRNFTDFLNNYRIKEACARLLADPNEAVLNIALDVGYRSLSSFNKAFKECEGMTPTGFRAHANKG